MRVRLGDLMRIGNPFFIAKMELSFSKMLKYGFNIKVCTVLVLFISCNISTIIELNISELIFVASSDSKQIISNLM